MRRFAYKKLDAFAAGRSAGNPAACLFPSEGEALDDADMLTIARHHKGFVSEVVYCTRLGQTDYGIRYFSSECEVDFCGHGTIACAYSLIVDTPELREAPTLTFHTRAKGSVVVHNEVAERDAVFIAAPEPVYLGTNLSLAAVAETLGTSGEALSSNHPLDRIDAGLRTLIVPVERIDVQVALWPDQATLKAFCESHDLDIVLVFSLATSRPDAYAHTRVFAPRFGYLEDPATGSGNSAFGYYLLKNNLWDGRPIELEQGGADRVFNTVKLDRREGRVLFGGGAVKRIDGEYWL